MPFCYAPWTNIDISPSGDISPCCKFQFHLYEDGKHNIHFHSIEDYKKSNLLTDVKKTFSENKWPKGCERCRIEEENNIESKRQLDYIRWETDYKNYNFLDSKFLTASIAFGNACNLKCITCNPNSSSTWRKEWKHVHNMDIKPLYFKHSSLVDEIITLTKDNLIHFDIPGGEPFISGVDEQKYILQFLVDSGRSKRVSIHYTTNITVFPDESWWELWKHFKEIDMQLSIDGVGNHCEYIRYPSNWETIYKNIKHYQEIEKKSSNLRLSISHTVSAYNIYYIGDFFEWCEKENLPKPWLGRVHAPLHMRPSVWPSKVRNEIVKKLKQCSYSDINNWITLIENTDDSEYFSEFLENLFKHDEYRNLNFSETFPEMAQFIK